MIRNETEKRAIVILALFDLAVWVYVLSQLS